MPSLHCYAEDQIAGLAGQLTLEQKVRLLSGTSVWSLHDEPAVGLRAIVMSDGPSGVRGLSMDARDPSASLPSGTAVAATWDTEKVRKLGQLVAAQARAKDVDVVLGPTINMHRSPRGGRHFESFSEDPWLTGVIGAAYVEGIQSCGVAATAKHYVCNDSETDRMTIDARVDERTLREVYLAPFERVVTDAGAWLVMSSYNQVNGDTMSASPLLRSPLKDEWGFDGVVVSDWTAVRDTDTSAASGQDLTMPGPHTYWGDALVQAVRAGRVSQAAIDDKVLRLLRLAVRVGALGNAPAATPRTWPENQVNDLLREVASDAMVLVRNDGLLPATPDTAGRVAVIGTHARYGRIQGGGSATVFPQRVISPLEGIRAAYGGGNVIYAAGLVPEPELHPLTQNTVTDPVTGVPGLRARYIDADGTAFAEEVFPTGQFGWIGEERLGRAAAIEVHTLYTPPDDGRRRIGFAAHGEVTFRVGERTLLSADIPIPTDADVVQAILSPSPTTFDVSMDSGVPIEVRLQFSPHLPGGFPIARLTLGTEDIYDEPAAELDRAVTLAAQSDLAIVVIGTTEAIESEGIDRPTLDLPDGQDELVRRVLAANRRTVVVVNSGAPVIMPWLHQAPAVLLSWFPGQEFGDALADVLTGRAEPGGRLPTTWPESEADVPIWHVGPDNDGRLNYTEGLHIGYRAWLQQTADGGPSPAVPFGYGLGYTTWEIGSPEITLSPQNQISISVPVTNTGSRRGKHVVQAYLSRPEPSAVDYPIRWLAGYAVVHADAGQTVTANIKIEERSLQHWSTTRQSWVQEPGTFHIHVGSNVTDLNDTQEIITNSLAPNAW